MATQTSSQKGNGPDIPDLSTYGIAPSGEPAEAMNCMGERVEALPFQRRIEFRAGKDGKPLLKDVLEVSRNTAAWVQTRGVQVPQPCSNCAAGNGPFTACVVLRMPNNQRFSDGSCANCYFGHSGSRCSHRGSGSSMPSAGLLGQFQSVRPSSESHIQMESSTKARPAPTDGWNKRRRTNKSMSAADMPISPLFVPADEPAPANGKPAADSARDDSTSKDPRIRLAAEQKEKAKNADWATSTPANKPPSNAPRRPKNMKTNTPKNEASPASLPPKPVQSKDNPPRVICGFLEPSPSPQDPPTNAPQSEEATASSGTSAHDKPVQSAQSRPETSGADTTKDSTMSQPESNTQDSQVPDSSKDKNLITCPLTPAMYNDASQLRRAVKELTKVLQAAEKRLEELEQTLNEADVWEMAIAKLETSDSV